MDESVPLDQLLEQARTAQQAFWTAAFGRPAFADASAFTGSEDAAFDGFWSALIGGVELSGGSPETLALGNETRRYADLIAKTWQRIRVVFETHRRAIHDPSNPAPDWRALRDRWVDIAEYEFLDLQRSPEFLTVQRDALRAAIRWRNAQSDEVRAAIDLNSQLGRTASHRLICAALTPVRVATTPKSEVWRNGKVSVSRYLPLAGQPVGGKPILICHGLIGRQTMTDLRPDRSLVRNLLAGGCDVFVLDWGDADRDDNTRGLDHYADQMLGAAIDAALAASGQPRLTLFGICQGGTLAAIQAACRPDRLTGLIVAGAPFDFFADTYDADPSHGLLNLWVRSLDKPDIEALIGLEGNVSGAFLGQVFNQLNPIRSVAKYAIRLPEAGRDPADLALFMAMEKWLADRPDLPGALARTWLLDCYHDNALIKGLLRIAGKPVDLGRLSMPVLNVFATGDHIIPAPCSRGLGQHVAPAQYRELALPTGHIGMFVSARAQTLLAPAILRWLNRVDHQADEVLA